MPSPSVCHACGAAVIWVRTHEGTSRPFDKDRDPASLWALSRPVNLPMRARVLAPGEQPLPGIEHRHQMHFDTCTERARIGNRHD